MQDRGQAVVTLIVPIKHVAAELGLNLYQIDTFRNWNPPKSINLVIAVSFGLLVPARILNGAQYGGLNVHPSLLPDLRGPAPIIHTLLKRRAYTGVTLQTMHPTLFDHGTILAQTQSPGVPVPADSTPDSLLKTLSPLGAELLCRGINDATFVPPVKDVRVDFPEAQHADYAPKVTPEDRRINWTTWTSDEILLRDRVLGRLWDNKTYSECLPNRYPKRVTFQGPWHTLDHPGARFTAGTPLTIHGGDSKAATLAIMTNDGKAVSPASVTVEGERKGNGVEALLNGFAGG